MVALDFYMNMYKRCNFSTTVVFHIYNMYNMHIQYTLTPVPWSAITNRARNNEHGGESE